MLDLVGETPSKPQDLRLALGVQGTTLKARNVILVDNLANRDVAGFGPE